MNIEDEFELEHLLFKERKCKSCNRVKDLLTDFYLTRKDRGSYPSAYSYECKACTIKRITEQRKHQRKYQQSKEYQRDDLYWYYPDW